MQKKIQFTQEGLEKLRKEYEDLEKQRVPAVQELTTARDMGDRSENAAYKSARWKLSGLDRRLRQLKNILKSAVIVSKRNDGTVQIGSNVTVAKDSNEVTYTIVGGYESDLANNMLSCYSPIGKALMNKKAGDTVRVTIPAGEVMYQIVAVS